MNSGLNIKLAGGQGGQGHKTGRGTGHRVFCLILCLQFTFCTVHTEAIGTKMRDARRILVIAIGSLISLGREFYLEIVLL